MGFKELTLKMVGVYCRKVKTKIHKIMALYLVITTRMIQ